MNFKKITAAILLIALSLVLISCGDEYIEHKNDEIGLAFSLPEDMEIFPYGEKNVITYRDKEGLFSFVINHYEISALEKIYGKDFTIKAYVSQAISELGIDEVAAPVYSNDGIRAVFEVTTGEDESITPQYLYHLIIKGEKKLYVVQFICSANDVNYYTPIFIELSKRVYAY